MANKEKMDYLLLDIRQLETLIAGMRDAEIYPVSFFSQTFDLIHKILDDVHTVEESQIDMLRSRMEAHRALIESLPEPVEEAEVKQEVKQEIKQEVKQEVPSGDMTERKNLPDFRKAFSLNDRFRFRRELFGGNDEKMNKAIADLNAMPSYEASVTYLNDELKWNIEDKTVADFLKLLEKRFA